MDTRIRPIPVVYFHGLPGSPDELQLPQHPLPMLPYVIDPLDFGAFSERHDPEMPVTAIGFSLGAFSALKLAALRPQSVAELVLISPAGPLEMGPFLDQMAGAPVFRTARANAFTFALLTVVQALAAHVSPNLLLSRMFEKSCAAERALLDDPAVVKCLQNGLRHSLWRGAPLYRRTIAEYVRPWESDLAKVQCRCRVFHGALDDWVPIGMARALYDRLPSGSSFQSEEGLGHYSTLIKIPPEILNDLSLQR